LAREVTARVADGATACARCDIFILVPFFVRNFYFFDFHFSAFRKLHPFPPEKTLHAPSGT